MNKMLLTKLKETEEVEAGPGDTRGSKTLLSMQGWGQESQSLLGVESVKGQKYNKKVRMASIGASAAKGR